MPRLVQARRSLVPFLCFFILLAFCIPGFAEDRDLTELRLKAEAGDPEAQYNLGVIYDLGVGITRSYAESGKWYLKAASQGLAEAQFQLGVRYFEFGKKAKENYTTAFTWFFKAATQGVPEAQYNVGVMYQLGRGVPPNQLEAYKWFNIAAAQGYAKAVFARETLGAEMKTPDVLEGDRRAAAFKPQRTFKTLASHKLGLDATPKSSGTGFFITEDGYLITNHHVVAEKGSYLVKTKTGNFPAKVIKTDVTNDLALLKVSGNFKPLRLGNSREPRLGQSVFTIGFPNLEMQGVQPKLTRGDINSLAGMQDDPRYFQISVPVQPGNSGGPLVDLNGNVLGVVSLRLGDWRALKVSGAIPQNVNYALKSSWVGTFLRNIPEVMQHLKPSSSPAASAFEEVAERTEEGVAIVLCF
jgi:S1-C subfamily serine protease